MIVAFPCLSPSDAAVAWEKLHPFLLPAIARNNFYLPEDVRELVTAEGGPWTIWVAADDAVPLGCWVTVIKRFPRGKALEVVFAGGREMKRWYAAAADATELFARGNGCFRLRAYGRPGWGRMPGFRTIGQMHERMLA